MTPKQERFVAEYLIDGNATRSAKAAGYSARTAKNIGFENLTKPDVIEAIAQGKARLGETAKKIQIGRIATRLERQAFWTRVMDDETVEYPSRLRAAQLLGLSEADFVERKEFSGPSGGPVEIVHDLSALTPEELRTLKAIRAKIR